LHTTTYGVNFYRAMLCVARTVLSQDVNTSVCLTHRYCVKAAKLILKLYHCRIATPF